MLEFLRPNRVKLSEAAREKILSDIWRHPPSGHIAVLFYYLKSTHKTPDGQILSETHNQFGWGGHLYSLVSDEDVWELDGQNFVLQDPRWVETDQLYLDVVGGCFHIRRVQG